MFNPNIGQNPSPPMFQPVGQQNPGFQIQPPAPPQQANPLLPNMTVNEQFCL